MTVNTCFKNMKTLGLPQVPLPSAFYFKEVGVLATHPLRNHPIGCLASEKSEDKIKENERK